MQTRRLPDRITGLYVYRFTYKNAEWKMSHYVYKMICLHVVLITGFCVDMLALGQDFFQNEGRKTYENYIYIKH